MSVDWTLSRINELVQGEILRGDGHLCLRGVATDSRAVRAGELFGALRGERRDGHDYVADAVAKGAAAAVVSREVPETIPQVLVRDTFEALRVLGRARRREFQGPVVAITGSCGKTTTKDLVGEVLARKYRTSVARDSFNNDVGVPLSILALEPGDEVLVLELGVSAPGEMARLGDAAAPTVAVITSVAPTHLEFFVDVAAVRREKMALLNYVKPGGTAVLNADDPLVAAMAAEIVNGLKVVTFGLAAEADVRPEELKDEGFAGSRFKLPGGAEVELPLPGEFNVMNALAAAAVGQVLGVAPEDMAAGLRTYCGRTLRSKVVTSGRGVTFFIDCYNSSPRAARASLAFVAVAPAEGRRVAVLGDMLELGAASGAAHREVGEFAGRGHFALVVGLGEGGRLIAEGARAAGMAPAATPFFPSKDELADFLTRELKKGDVVLLKASRAVRLEAILAKVGVTVQGG